MKGLSEIEPNIVHIDINQYQLTYLQHNTASPKIQSS